MPVISSTSLIFLSESSITQSTKYVANMIEKDWLNVNIEGDGRFYGNNVWSDGENAYCYTNGKHYQIRENSLEEVTFNVKLKI